MLFHKIFHTPLGSKSVAHETFSKKGGSCNPMLFLSAEMHCIHINPSHAVRDLSRVRQLTAFVDSVGYPRYNPQKTCKQ